LFTITCILYKFFYIFYNYTLCFSFIHALNVYFVNFALIVGLIFIYFFCFMTKPGFEIKLMYFLYLYISMYMNWSFKSKIVFMLLFTQMCMLTYYIRSGKPANDGGNHAAGMMQLSGKIFGSILSIWIPNNMLLLLCMVYKCLRYLTFTFDCGVEAHRNGETKTAVGNRLYVRLTIQ
jgi:hypothetical protein